MVEGKADMSRGGVKPGMRKWLKIVEIPLLLLMCNAAARYTPFYGGVAGQSILCT